MPDAPSYTTVPGRIPELLKKVRDTGVPPKATYDWLRSLGFTSSNDRTLISVLRQIGFIDASGVPQPAWREYRGGDHRRVLARAVALGYDTVFATYPDAHARTATELAHVFSTKTDAGKQAVGKMVATFNNLVKEADFDGVGSGVVKTVVGSSADPEPSAADGDQGTGQGGDKGDSSSSGVRVADAGASLITETHTKSGVTINVNVQLTLPETTDEKVFEAFFSAMRKHLIDDNTS